MSRKYKFLKSAKVAIAAAVLATGLSSCSLMSEKHSCKSDEAKAEKSSCSAKNSCNSAKAEKASCSSKHSCAAN